MDTEKKVKIVKWTAGLDRSVIGRAKLLYPAFGDDFNDMPHEEFNRLWHDADQTVIDCIRRNGFKFGGYYHQDGEFGMPMFDDGKIFFVTFRHWGHLMYEAWHPDSPDAMGYCKYAWEYDMRDAGGKTPKHETDFV